MNNLLYIGLNGYAGSGKDTVAKMLKTILSQNWDNFEDYKKYYFETYTNPTQSATYNVKDKNDSPVLCIAYADQLKEICAKMFGIPRERFYQNKSTAWICINDKFQYTEIKPDEDHIITAEDFFYKKDDSSIKYWMSLREILVYIGTYVLQQDINRNTFVNIVRNNIINTKIHNPYLRYVIVTDNRFSHELDFIKENNGITITITRDSVMQLDNVAEHELDDEENYDFIIDNSGSYDDLIKQIWDIVKSNIEFSNETIDLYTRENINNYLRLIDKTEDGDIYKLCYEMKIQQLYGSGSDISALNPIGGPLICVNEPIDGTISIENPKGIIPYKIVMTEKNEILIYT